MGGGAGLIEENEYMHIWIPENSFFNYAEFQRGHRILRFLGYAYENAIFVKVPALKLQDLYV